LCVVDYLDALQWVESLGGVAATMAKSNDNLSVLQEYVASNDWIDFLAQDSNAVSNTSVCFTLKATPDQVKDMVKLLADEGVAYDIAAYRDAPSGLRIWCGATVEVDDLLCLCPWLTWAYESVKNK
jgi:phosphoserine aminotransferase